MNQSIFITGTSTDIGKTFVSAMMLSAAITHQLPLNYFKPIQSGDDLDCDTVSSLSGSDPDRIIQPVYSFALPATPYLAARAENKKVDHLHIKQRFQEISQTPCMVEGAGGLLVPVCEKTTVRDMIKALNLPVLVVASTALGTMNHTLLTIEALLNANIGVKGIVLSGDEYPDLVEVLHGFSPVRVLAEVPRIERINFKEEAARIFSRALLLDIFASTSAV